MGQDTGKNERAGLPPLSPLNKRDNRAKQHAGIPRHERYTKLYNENLEKMKCTFAFDPVKPSPFPG
ncbi:hypothetical protein BK140_14705 [Paenibacillus macerans]|nr:hypothetical protein BK140_14705 [Paenibacillus macerans]